MAIRCVATGGMPGGEQWSNTLHFAGVLSDQDEAGIIAGNVTDFYTEFSDQLVTDWTLEKIAVGQAGFPASFEFATDLNGAGSSTPIPNDCAVAVTFTTAVPGRSGRGRIFLGGFALSLLVRLDGTGATVLNEGLSTAIGVSVVNNLMGPDLGPVLVVYSRKLDDENTVLGGAVARRLATQRRRDMDTPRAADAFG